MLLGLAGCTGEGAVSYSRDVQPILQANCLSCHQQGGAGYETSGFSMASYDDLMKGTKFGPMIVAGDSEGSNLIVLMEGRADPVDQHAARQRRTRQQAGYRHDPPLDRPGREEKLTAGLPIRTADSAMRHAAAASWRGCRSAGRLSEKVQQLT